MFRIALLLFATKSALCGLPSMIPRCRFDPNTIDGCLKDVLETIRPSIMTGHFGDGVVVKGLDPMHIPFHGHDTDNFNLTLLEGVAFGQWTTIINRIKCDLQNMTFLVDSVVPDIRFKGQLVFYINLEPYLSNGGGTINVHFKNFTSLRKISFKREIVNGTEYVRLKRFQQRIKVDDAHFHSEHLHGTAENLQDAADEVLNNEREFILKSLIPQLEERSVEVYEKIISKLFKSVTMQDMFIL